MKKEPDQLPRILFCRLLPARLSRRLTADILGLNDVDSIRPIVKAKLLRPLGKPVKGGQLWFFTEDVLNVARNRRLMDKVTLVTSAIDQ